VQCPKSRPCSAASPQQTPGWLNESHVVSPTRYERWSGTDFDSADVQACVRHLDSIGQQHGGVVTGHRGGAVLVGLHDPDGNRRVRAVGGELDDPAGRGPLVYDFDSPQVTPSQDPADPETLADCAK
jgi:hypothetical protein